VWVTAGFHTGRQAIVDFLDCLEEESEAVGCGTYNREEGEEEAISPAALFAASGGGGEQAAHAKVAEVREKRGKGGEMGQGGEGGGNGGGGGEGRQGRADEACGASRRKSPGCKRRGPERISSRLAVETIFECDMDGRTRPWARQRADEGVEERKKWVVVMILARKDG
jgi:hypothetical protein